MPDIGKLQFLLTSNNSARPIKNATISIYEQNEDGRKQVEELKTNESGRSLEVELPAPPLEYSLSVPQADNIPKPYSTYDISVLADGFEPLLVKDIQILPKATAIQRCDLVGQNFMLSKQQAEAEIIVISPHTLYKEFPEKTPEDAVKPLPEPTGFVVLDQVVVPETIVVHAGTPDNKTAPNYYVNFRDYIKNVIHIKHRTFKNALSIYNYTVCPFLCQ